MSSDVFGADPMELQEKGSRINNIAVQFRDNYGKIFTTVEEMVNSDYLDPAARAIAENIHSYKDELANMANVIENYGNYCLKAGNAVIDNQDNIISGIGSANRG